MFNKQTKLLGLPQWEPKDHPDFLTDMNDAYSKIDNRFQKLDGLTAEAFSTLSQQVEENTANINILHDETEGLSKRVTAIDNKLEEHDEKLESVTDNVSELVRQLALETQERQKEDSALKVELDSLEARVETNEDSIVTISEQVKLLQNEQELLQDDNANLHTELVNVQGDINDLRDGLSDQSNSIADLQAKDKELEEKIAGLGDVSELEDAVNDLQSSVNNNINNIETIEGDIKVIKKNLEDLENDKTDKKTTEDLIRTLSEHNIKISQNSNDIETLKNASTVYGQEIGKLESRDYYLTKLVAWYSSSPLSSELVNLPRAFAYSDQLGRLHLNIEFNGKGMVTVPIPQIDVGGTTTIRVSVNAVDAVTTLEPTGMHIYYMFVTIKRGESNNALYIDTSALLQYDYNANGQLQKAVTAPNTLCRLTINF